MMQFVNILHIKKNLPLQTMKKRKILSINEKQVK